MMKTPLRVLCIEDTEMDAELLKAHLSLQEFDVVLERVETSEGLAKALADKIWDVVLADYSLPQFNAVMALKIIKASGLDLPVIIVSGTIGEDRAIEMMRAGANDFIVKGDFLRLLPAIRRELTEALNRKARREAEAALAASRDSFKQLADAMPQLVWTADPQGQITFVNQRFIAFTGLHEEQILGDRWREIVQPREFLEKFDESISLGKELSLQHQLRQINGEHRWFLTRATPTRDHSGKLRIWYATSTDIHEQKTLNEELHAAKVMAEQASEAKSAFLANMSHEIRTPLGAILGFAELMEDSHQSEEERKECIQTIRRNGHLLSRVINEILDLSKIESRKLELEEETFVLSEAMEDIRNLLDLNAKEKGLSLEFQIDEKLPEKVVGDSVRLRQILINLIGNAIKFTEKGKVTVKARSFPANGVWQKLEFEISDTGMGIPEEQARKLFQPFVQGDNTMTRRFGGTGLGLHLSRRLAQAMGGDVTLLRSVVGEGSVFCCTLQLKLPSA